MILATGCIAGEFYNARYLCASARTPQPFRYTTTNHFFPHHVSLAAHTPSFVEFGLLFVGSGRDIVQVFMSIRSWPSWFPNCIDHDWLTLVIV
jgi:hypothetical protein